MKLFFQHKMKYLLQQRGDIHSCLHLLMLIVLIPATAKFNYDAHLFKILNKKQVGKRLKDPRLVHFRVLKSTF
jgi:hypothetical protein